MTAPLGPRVGRAVARIDPADWSLHPFVTEPLKRPIDVVWHAGDGALYVLDFGEFEMDATQGVVAQAHTGRLWRIR
jgi:hypothetical protein